MTRLTIRVATLVLAAGITACGGSSGGSESPASLAYEYRQPTNNGDNWDLGHAAGEAIDVAMIETMMNGIRNGQFDVIDSVVIARNGTLVFDETIRTATAEQDSWVGNTDVRVHAQFSAIKSVTAMAVGSAIDQGYMPGVDTPFLDFFSYASYDNWDDRKNDITLGHVLAMRTGFEWDEWSEPYTSPDNTLIRFYDSQTDFAKGLLDLPLADDPGSKFVYNTVATVSLAQAIENSAPLSFIDFEMDALFTPLGITTIQYLSTPTGLPRAGGDFYLRTRDMAKFGQVVLDDGVWKGNRIVSAAWLDEMLAITTPMQWQDPTGRDWVLDGYGYQWWLGHYEIGGEMLDSLVMWGFGGQWVVVVPARQLVVAINSHSYDDGDEAVLQAHRLIADYILPASN